MPTLKKVFAGQKDKQKRLYKEWKKERARGQNPWAQNCIFFLGHCWWCHNSFQSLDSFNFCFVFVFIVKMGYPRVHFVNFMLLFFVFELGTVLGGAQQKVDYFSTKSFQNPGKSYQNHHNACTRKLMCLIASQKNGYNNIIQGKHYWINIYNALQLIGKNMPFKFKWLILHLNG